MPCVTPSPEPARCPSALWIVRHGESAGNVAREAAELHRLERIEIAARRDMDVPLSTLGEEQARAFGRWLGEQPRLQRPTVVLCSPYLRARETARLALAEAGLGDLRVAVDERLREREFGVLDRLTRQGIEQEYPDQAEFRSLLGKFYHRPPGGESWCDVILRLRGALGSLALDHRGERVLVFCHTVVVLCLRYLLEELDEEQILAIDRAAEIANCGLTSYELDAGRRALSLRRYNFVAPLEGQGAPVTTEPDVPVAPK
ncbi:MAG: histidine phosphatase family protein [Myxococcales bacterium]